jgi:hypothetical protein
MAEEMVEIEASDTKSKNCRSNRKTKTSALEKASSKALDKSAAVRHVAGEPSKARAHSKSGKKCAGARVPKELSSEVKEFVGNHLKAILNGVLKGVKHGKATGAKLLFDYYNAADAESGEEGLSAAEGIHLSDIFGDDFDWNSLQHADELQAAETAEAGIDVGPEVEIAGREPE